jgi:uncharacterized membrane protein
MSRDSEGPDSSFFRRVVVSAKREDSSQRGPVGWFRRRFIVGLLVAFPLIVTLFFANFLFDILDPWFHPISMFLFDRQIPGIGFALVLIGIFLLGMVSTNMIGGRLIGFFERRVSWVPFLSQIYRVTRQITEAIQIRDSGQFQRVVLLPFPHPGVKSVGFVTREFRRPTRFGAEPTTIVFVPTTPNPTSGFLVAVPEQDLIPLDVSVEEGAKLVISAGLITPNTLLRDPADVRRQLDDTLDGIRG